MSENTVETAYERGRRHGETGTGPGSSGGGNFLTKNLGPLPVWTWLALALGLAVAYFFYKKNASASSTSAQSSSASTGTTNSSLIPQFVNQVYTNGTPPTSPGHHGKKGGGSTSGGGGSSSTGTTNPNSAVIVAVPNGTGGWMDATFPSQQALNNFYSSIGVTNGAYPNGLNNQQLTQGIDNAGGSVASAVYLGHQ